MTIKFLFNSILLKKKLNLLLLKKKNITNAEVY